MGRDFRIKFLTKSEFDSFKKHNSNFERHRLIDEENYIDFATKVLARERKVIEEKEAMKDPDSEESSVDDDVDDEYGNTFEHRQGRSSDDLEVLNSEEEDCNNRWSDWPSLGTYISRHNDYIESGIFDVSRLARKVTTLLSIIEEAESVFATKDGKEYTELSKELEIDDIAEAYRVYSSTIAHMILRNCKAVKIRYN